MGYLYDHCMAKRIPRGRNNQNHAVGQLSIVYLRPNDNQLFYQMILSNNI